MSTDRIGRAHGIRRRRIDDRHLPRSGTSSIAPAHCRRAFQSLLTTPRIRTRASTGRSTSVSPPSGPRRAAAPRSIPPSAAATALSPPPSDGRGHLGPPHVRAVRDDGFHRERLARRQHRVPLDAHGVASTKTDDRVEAVSPSTSTRSPSFSGSWSIGADRHTRRRCRRARRASAPVSIRVAVDDLTAEPHRHSHAVCGGVAIADGSNRCQPQRRRRLGAAQDDPGECRVLDRQAPVGADPRESNDLDQLANRQRRHVRQGNPDLLVPAGEFKRHAGHVRRTTPSTRTRPCTRRAHARHADGRRAQRRARRTGRQARDVSSDGANTRRSIRRSLQVYSPPRTPRTRGGHPAKTAPLRRGPRRARRPGRYSADLQRQPVHGGSQNPKNAFGLDPWLCHHLP